MRIKKIITEIDRIAKIDSPEETQVEVRDLDKQIKAPKFEFKVRGNYAYGYVYEIEYRSDVRENRRKYTEKIGRIPKEIYLKNKKIIDQMSIEELQKYEYLEQY